MLVVPGKPRRQVDVEVVSSILGITRCYTCEGATKSIEYKNENFNADYGDQYKRVIKIATPGSNGDSHDASGKECPDQSVSCLDDAEGSDRWIIARRVHAV